MKQELEDKLVKKYSEFFQHLVDNNTPMINKGEPIEESFKKLKKQKPIVVPMQFGFECGDGWYWLLNQLMGNIHWYCKNNKIEYPTIDQIKEKFGGLRFYYSGGNQKIDGMVSLAESMSYHICEKCGTNKNVGRTEGWITTLCKTCAGKIESIVWREYKE